MKKQHLIMFIGTVVLALPHILQADTLQSVMRKALETNPQVLAARHDMLARQQDVALARSGYYPRLDLSLAKGRETSENSSTFGVETELTRSEASVVLRQNLFQGFATESEVEQRQQGFNSASHRLMGDKEAVALKVAAAYLQVLRYREELVRAKAFVQSHQDIYNKVEKKAEAGVGRKSELEQAKGRLAQARSSLIVAQSELNQSNINYLTVVGEIAADNMLMPDELAVPEQLSDVQKLARADNPEIAAALSAVQAAQAQRNVSRGRFYPELDLMLSASRNENLNGISGDDNDQLVMLEMRYNLFNGGGDSARKKQAAVEMARARYLRDNTYRIVDQALGIAWQEYQARNAQMDSLRQHVKSSIKARQAYANQYRLGKRSLLDLLNTENEVFNAERALIAASYDRLLAQYKLFAYMGRLQKAILH